MNVIETGIAGLLLIEPRAFGDERGFFMESWNERTFAKQGIDARFVQDNHSRSARGVLRGLHYQIGSAQQGKLVRVTRGRVFDVAVDLRRSSPSFGRWAGFEISGENQRMLWIPPGFAHGFVTLEDETDFFYKCTDFYSPEHERSVLWNDPTIGIEWPLDGLTPTLSPKDAAAPAFADAETLP